MLTVQAVEGLPRISSGDDLAALLSTRLHAIRWPDGSTGIGDSDIVVVASKVVAKAEGRLVAARTRRELEEVIAEQTVRIVAERRRADGSTLRIVQNRQGLVLAAAGVDSSDVPPKTALLLPEKPDTSARRLRRGLYARLGVRPGVVITDTVGRPWRHGVADIAIGAAGVVPLLDHRGRRDDYGRTLSSTVIAAADEIAAAAELVKGKADGRPVAVARGLGHLVTSEDGEGVAVVARPAEEDLFPEGSREAYERGFAAGLVSRSQL